MKKIKAISVWWYDHHPADTEVNFHRHGKLGSYRDVTPSSRERLGNTLRNCLPSVSISANYTYIYYAMKDQS